MHGPHTRSKNQLFIPIVNFTSVQKNYLFGIKIYNNLSSNILNFKNDKKQFKSELYRYQWRTEGGFGVFKPPRNSEGPPKSCQTQPDL